MAILSTRLNKTQKMNVNEKCNEEGISVCEYIRQLIQKDLQNSREDEFEPSGQNVHIEDKTQKGDIENIVDGLAEGSNDVAKDKDKRTAIQMLIDLSHASKKQVNAEEERYTNLKGNKLDWKSLWKVDKTSLDSEG